MSTLPALALVLSSFASAAPAPSAAPAAQEKDRMEKPMKAEKAMASKDDPALKQVHEFLSQRKIDTSVPTWKTQLPRPPQLTFDEKSNYFWVIETNKGPLKIRLMPEVAPMHVSSTIYLTELGFYDGLPFHRVIPGFMAQGGCPLGNGRGNPGYTYDSEFDPKVVHDRPGLLSMANTGRPESDGSQFFLTFVPTPHLNMKHTIFGEIVEGMDTLRALERAGTSGAGTPKEPLTMTKCTIVVEPKPAATEGTEKG